MPAQADSLAHVVRLRSWQRRVALATVDRFRSVGNGPAAVGRLPGAEQGAAAARVDTFARSAASWITAGQIAVSRAGLRFVADYASSELQQPISPLDIDPREFTGAHF